MSAGPDSLAVPLGVVQIIVPTFFCWKDLPVRGPRMILTTLPVNVIVDPAAVTFCLSA